VQIADRQLRRILRGTTFFKCAILPIFLSPIFRILLVVRQAIVLGESKAGRLDILVDLLFYYHASYTVNPAPAISNCCII
jgi:hypothetical protein